MKKVITQFPDYSVTTDGVVTRNFDGKILKQPLASRGYPRVMLNKDGQKRRSVYVHRLVALTFIDNPENKKEVNHIDGNKLNCHVSNLEWVTLQQNMQHAYENKLMNPGWPGKPVIQLSKAGEFIKEWPSMAVAAKELGLHEIHKISKVARNIPYYKTCAGFRWAFK